MTVFTYIADKFNKPFLKLLGCVFFVFSSVEALEKKHNETISVVIPSHYKHAVYLLEAIEAYSHQSELPIEVIVSLSDINLVEKELVSHIEECPWPFKLVILKHSRPVSEGENRNIACRRARGSVIVCSDADDLPHFQRIEIIKWFFDFHDIDFLLHTFTHNMSDWRWLDPSSIEWFVPSYINEGCSFANGAPAFRRKVFDRIQYDQSFRMLVDVDFNRLAMHLFKKHILIKCPIYLYRNHLTTYR